MLKAIYSIIVNNGIIEENKGIYSDLQKLFESSDKIFKLDRINDLRIIKRILSLKENDIDNLFDKEEKNKFESNYYKTYRKFYDFFIKKEELSIYLNAFYYEGIHKLEIAHLTLSDDEDEFLVFESINSKGRSLSSADLIKNYIMMSLDDKKLEEKFEEQIGKRNPAEATNDKELSLFYNQILMFRKKRIITENKMYLFFKEEWSKDDIQRNKNKFLNNLIVKWKIWCYIHDDLNKNNPNHLYLPLLKGTLINYYSLIYVTIRKNSEIINGKVKIKKVTGIKNINYVCEFLSKLVVYRLFSNLKDGLSRQKYSILAYELNEELDRKKNDNFRDIFKRIVIKELVDNNADAFRMPKVNELNISSNKDYPFYSIYNKNKNLLKWVFISMEVEKSTNKKILNDEDKYSIEHIYPQNSTKWNLSEEEKNDMGKLLHTLGNLSLIEISSNSSIGNKNFIKKRDLMRKKSYLKMDDYIYKQKDWNKNTIHERAKEIISIAIDTWK